MSQMTADELRNVSRSSSTLTLRESVFQAESTGGRYTYLLTELWSDGIAVVKVSIRHAVHAGYSHAFTHVTFLDADTQDWQETGISRTPEAWHRDLRSYSQYSTPVEATYLAADLAKETAKHLGL